MIEVGGAQTYGDARTRALAALSGLGLDAREAEAQADWLLAYVCTCGRADLRLRAGDALDEHRAAQYAALLARLMAGEPLQYLLGTQDFMGFEFAVDARVLIPRLDTEVLCGLALEHIPESSASNVLDVGTGSGALAVSIALLRPLAAVTALDISADALAVAQENARRHKAKVRFVQSDFFAKIPGECFEVIVSNPPYIERGALESLPANVRREPLLALDGGDDGLNAYRLLAREAAAHLLPGGRLLVEVGAGQAVAVAALFQSGIGPAETHCDLQGVRRIVSAVRE